jgi:hypothetical protein
MDPSRSVDLPLLTGDESLLPGVTVRDFWAWALGDLRLNANRGMLAQFLTAKAVGDPRPRDDGWGDFDVLTPDGIKVEVKSSGYLQSWAQKAPSKLVFSGLKARSWDASTGYCPEATFRADVYVFAVHTCTDPSVYDPLDLTAWEFWVLQATVIRRLNQKTLTHSRLKALASGPVAWSGLADSIRAAAREANLDEAPEASRT